MLSLAAALAQNFLFRIEDKVEETVARSKRTAIFLGIAGLLLLTAYMLAVTAICISLAQRYGAISALWGVAGAVTALALVLIAVLLYLNRRDAKLRGKHRHQLEARRQLAAVAIGSAARQPLATAALGVALALFMRPRSRKRRREE